MNYLFNLNLCLDSLSASSQAEVVHCISFMFLVLKHRHFYGFHEQNLRPCVSHTLG